MANAERKRSDNSLHPMRRQLLAIDLLQSQQTLLHQYDSHGDTVAVAHPAIALGRHAPANGSSPRPVTSSKTEKLPETRSDSSPSHPLRCRPSCAPSSTRQGRSGRGWANAAGKDVESFVLERLEQALGQSTQKPLKHALTHEQFREKLNVQQLRDWVYGSEDFLKRMLLLAARSDAETNHRRERKAKSLSVDQILSAVAGHYGVDPHDYYGFRSPAGGRDLSAFLCRRYNGVTLRELSSRFGLSIQTVLPSLFEPKRDWRSRRNCS